MTNLRIQHTYKNELPTIFLLPTPIGNMNDISNNVIEHLKNVKILYCEDTRTTKVLLNKLNIKDVKTKSFHKYNEDNRSNELLDDLLKYSSIGICSDAGMPGICDPGMAVLNKLLSEDNSFNLTIISPNCAFLGSLLISGLYFNDFSFIGFLPKKDNQIKEIIENNSNKGNLVFYESVHRIIKTTEILNDVLDETTNISIVRELTKLNEEVICGKIKDVLEYLKSDNFVLKGEFCVVIENKYLLKNSKVEINNIQVFKEIDTNIKNGFKLKDSVKLVCDKYNLNKNNIYNLYIKEKGE